jgi:hypothetical protein
VITTLSVSKEHPFYRFTGSPTAVGSEYYALNTVVNGAGLNISATNQFLLLEMLLRMLSCQLQPRMQI